MTNTLTIRRVAAVVAILFSVLSIAGCYREAAPGVASPVEVVAPEDGPPMDGFGTIRVMAPGEEYVFASGSRVKLEAEPYRYPRELSGYRVTDKAALDARYIKVRLTYTNASPEPRLMNGMLMVLSTASGNGWLWTLGVPTKTVDGPIRPGATGVLEEVYRAPEVEPGATEAFGSLYEPWPSGQGLGDLLASGTPPESVEFRIPVAG